MRRSRWRTRPSTGSPPTSSRATSAARTASARRSTTGWWRSTTARSAGSRRRSAASRAPATRARAAASGSRTTLTFSTSALIFSSAGRPDRVLTGKPDITCLGLRPRHRLRLAGLDCGFAPLELTGVCTVNGLEPLVRAEERVAAHIGAVAARRGRAAERLGDAADVVRRGAAAHAEVGHAEPRRGGGELAELEAVARERVERDRERAVAGDAVAVRVGQRLEARLGVRRAVRDGQRGDVAVAGGADALDQRQHRARAADAVQADDRRAGVLDPPARVLRRPALARLGRAVDRERDDRGQAGLLDHVERDQRLLGPGERLANDEVDVRVDRPRDLLLEHRPHRRRGFSVARVLDVRVADVAGVQRAGLPRDLGGARKRAAVDLLERVLLADHPQLLAVRVVGEGLDHVGAGVDELAVELGDELRVVEDDLGHERAGLQVAAALELEQVALSADDGALRETLEESVHRASLQPGLRPLQPRSRADRPTAR